MKKERSYAALNITTYQKSVYQNQSICVHSHDILKHVLSGTLGALVPSRQAAWLRIEEWKCIGQNYSFSSGFLSTMLLSFLSYSLFLMQQTPPPRRAIVVKCDSSVYDVDRVLTQYALLLVSYFSDTGSFIYALWDLFMIKSWREVDWVIMAIYRQGAVLSISLSLLQKVCKKKESIITNVKYR